jgi:putative transposase
LLKISRRLTNPHRLVVRARIILQMDSGANNDSIARQMKINRETVRYWRATFLSLQTKLEQAEAESLDDKSLTKLIEEGLTDKPRSGAPPTFTPEQICQIVAVACEDPSESGRPISHWSERELADEVQKRKIVATISVRSVGRFLKSSGFEATQSGAVVKRQA